MMSGPLVQGVQIVREGSLESGSSDEGFKRSDFEERQMLTEGFHIGNLLGEVVVQAFQLVFLSLLILQV
jgi:hypothetical protein